MIIVFKKNIDEIGGLNGDFIGRVEGAISADTSLSHLAVITENGELYTYGTEGSTDWNKLGTGYNFKLNQLTLIELPKR